MGAILDFAIMGLLFYAGVALAYFIGNCLLLAACGLLWNRNLGFLSTYAPEAAKASLVAASFNSLSVTAIAVMIFGRALNNGPSIMGLQPGSPFGMPSSIALYISALMEKLILYSAMSLAFWLAASAAILAFLIRRRGRKARASSLIRNKVAKRAAN